MNKLLLTLFAFVTSTAFSQFCSTLSLANMGAITPTTTWQNVTGAASFKRYWTFTGVAGCTYDFSTCNSINTNDTYLRLYSTATGGSILSQNDDNGPFCGGSKASLTWICPANGTYSILVTNWSCANLSASTILSFRRTCATYNPCTSITTIPACGTNVSATMSGTGAGWNLTSCGFTTPGQERIFQFTPTTTGTYTFNITSIAGGWIDFFWKPASSGCNATGWNCIEDASVAGSYTPVVPMNFTAGVTYYILVDPEVTTVTNVTFNIGCPPVYNPCSSITTIPACGTNVSAAMIGGGAGWSPGSCGWATPGQERMFQFTPTITATYSLNVTAISGGYINFFWKLASGGCNATGWNCIDDINVTGAYPATTPMALTAGVTYYILADPEVTTATTVTFNIGCPTTGPCLNPTPYAVASMPTITTPSVTSTCASGFGQFTNEYSQWNTGIASTPYTVLSSIPTDWITITVASPTGTVVQTGTSPLNFIAPSNNTYYVHINVNGYCADDANCRNVTISRISALPVELMYFEGTDTEQGNLLTWKTATEHNSDYYLIEHSVTGEFNEKSVIGMRPAAGNSTTEITYSFVDNEFPSTINYYQLTQVDIDGNFKTYGPIVIDNTRKVKTVVKLINLIGQEITDTAVTGVYIEVYSDGTMKKVYK